MLAASSSIIQLISYNPSIKCLYLTQEGKQFLSSLQSQSLCIVTVAGLYRTGKSYLVNQLIKRFNHKDEQQSRLNQQDKYLKNFMKVGNSIQSCTKGLNIYSRPISSPYNSNITYLLIDSQGIGSFQQQQQYDINLLMLIFMISSTVIYNSVGAIDEQSLDQLRVVVKLGEKLKAEKEQREKQSQQPRFIWVLRDFALQLINKYGEIMNSNQYLEDCLEEVNSTNKQIIKKNQIRQAIKQHLPQRQCHTLVRPTINQHDLSDLSNIPSAKLRQQFRTQLDMIYSSIFHQKTSETSKNLLNGFTLIQLIQFTINELNQNKVPQVKQIWRLIESTKWEQNIEECEQQLKKETIKIDLPIEQKELKNKLNQIQQKIFVKYEQKLCESNTESYKKFQKIFLQMTQKINIKLKNANSDIKRKKLMKFVRDHINRQIDFQNINPCKLMEIKSVIDELGLKEKSQIHLSQVYQYLMTTIWDILQISEKKSIGIKKQLEFMKYEVTADSDNIKVKDEELLKLKQNYNETLKNISVLKAEKIDDSKNLSILKQQFEVLEQKYHNLVVQKQQKDEEHYRQIYEINEKLRTRGEEHIIGMKKLREENRQFIDQVELLKNEIEQMRMRNRKQTIFEDNIKANWDRFEQQRRYFKGQVQKYRQKFYQTQQKLKISEQKYQKLQIQHRQGIQKHQKRQKQFCEQLKWLRETYARTKQAYSKSHNIREQNNKILDSIDRRRVPLKESRLNERIETQQNSQVQSLKESNKSLLKQIASLKYQFQSRSQQLLKIQQNSKLQINELQQRTKMLQQSNQSQKSHFYQCLKQLQEDKNRERQMYEQSITRLLNNMGKKKVQRTAMKQIEVNTGWRRK